MATIEIPTPSSVLVTNLTGLASLIAVVVAVGVLTAWPWALLTAGVAGLALTVLGQLGLRQSAVSAAATPNNVRQHRRAA